MRSIHIMLRRRIIPKGTLLILLAAGMVFGCKTTTSFNITVPAGNLECRNMPMRADGTPMYGSAHCLSLDFPYGGKASTNFKSWYE